VDEFVNPFNRHCLVPLAVNFCSPILFLFITKKLNDDVVHELSSVENVLHVDFGVINPSVDTLESTEGSSWDVAGILKRGINLTIVYNFYAITIANLKRKTRSYKPELQSGGN
jgi:hypothetical protein